MAPKKIQSFFKTTCHKMDGDNTLIEGLLTCCDSCEFEVWTAGSIRHGLFSGIHLVPIDDIIALKVRCKKCGKVISVFDSSHDGYEQCETKCGRHASTEPFVCKNCAENTFSVRIKYEYPDYQELVDLGITEIDNAFTWIWVTLECNKCGKRYSNFINFETA